MTKTISFNKSARTGQNTTDFMVPTWLSTAVPAVLHAALAVRGARWRRRASR